MDLVTSDKESEPEVKSTSAHKRKTLKSGKIRNAELSVLHKVVWPHKVVCTVTAKLAKYEGISILLFVSGYLAIMAAEKPSVHPLMAQHLQELMGEAELYGWEPIRAFHTVCSNNWNREK